MGIVASYWGHFRHAAFVKLTQRLIREFSWLSWCFHFSLHSALQMRWANKRATSYQLQKQFFQQSYPSAQITLQCGITIETIKPTQHSAKAFVRVEETGWLRSGIKRREVTQINIPIV